MEAALEMTGAEDQRSRERLERCTETGGVTAGGSRPRRDTDMATPLLSPTDQPWGGAWPMLSEVPWAVIQHHEVSACSLS